MSEKDIYKTLSKPSEEILFKEKNSKFYGYAFPIKSEDEAKTYLEQIKKKHPNAVHHCYAFQINPEQPYYRANDDGEPNNTAGLPIYGQIQSYNITNTLLVVVRYFGGIKLGVGGLISAYRTTAQMTLENSDIIEKTIDVYFQLSFDYKNMNKVMQIIKRKQLTIVSQKMNEKCQIEITSRKKNETLTFESFNSLPEIDIKKI